MDGRCAKERPCWHTWRPRGRGVARELVETMAAHDDGRGIPDGDADDFARQEADDAEHGDEDEDAGVLTGVF